MSRRTMMTNVHCSSILPSLEWEKRKAKRKNMQEKEWESSDSLLSFSILLLMWHSDDCDSEKDMIPLLKKSDTTDRRQDEQRKK
jgi:hypothetical protein